MNLGSPAQIFGTMKDAPAWNAISSNFADIKAGDFPEGINMMDFLKEVITNFYVLDNKDINTYILDYFTKDVKKKRERRRGIKRRQ